MQKIITLFQRDYEGTRLVVDQVVEGAEWVLAGEGIATRKFDGTGCLVRNGMLFKRYDAKRGRTPPEGFEPAEPEPNEHTGHWPGWLPVGDGPEDRWHREAWANASDENGGRPPDDGTYELIGPKVQGNVEVFDHHCLIRHGVHQLLNVPRTYAGLRSYFEADPFIEGIVWHHPDGRMVKIKGKDFGVKRLAGGSLAPSNLGDDR